MAVRTYEQALNFALAEELRKHGVAAEAERRIEKKRVDVLIGQDELRVVLEAEIDRRPQAVREADRRLRDGLTTVAFAIDYPPDLTSEGVASAELRGL